MSKLDITLYNDLLEFTIIGIINLIFYVKMIKKLNDNKYKYNFRRIEDKENSTLSF